jgi:cytoskeleton protein RodZ
MPAFGENLRREREMRGVSLEEIASATKISLRFLDAIEREDFKKLPGGIFGRSFIRTYAKYLGLDEERVMAEFQLAASPQAEVDIHRMAANRSGAPSARTPLLATLVAIIMFGGGYELYRYSRRASEIPVPPPPSVAVTPAPVNPAATPPATPDPNAPAGETNPAANSVTPAAGGVTTGQPNPANAPAAGVKQDTGLQLQVAATERAWVAVDADGKTAFQRVLNPQEVETVKARESFDVTTGNAQGVILTLNGETLKPVGRRGEVKSVHITRDDLKNPAP